MRKNVFAITALIIGFFASNAFAALTRSQQSFIAKQIQVGNDYILQHLSMNGQSLEEANVDIEALVSMIQRGDVRALSDRRLNYNVHSRKSQGEKSPGPRPLYDKNGKYRGECPKGDIYLPGYCDNP
jgi:hypothetical protein